MGNQVSITTAIKGKNCEEAILANPARKGALHDQANPIYVGKCLVRCITPQ